MAKRDKKDEFTQERIFGGAAELPIPHTHPVNSPKWIS